MGLITRCPACGTMFKVVSDQLKVSNGWVRCGQCAEIFDAQLYWQSNTDMQIQQVPSGATPSGMPIPDQIVETPSDLSTGLQADAVTAPESTSISSAMPDAIHVVKSAGVEHETACANDPDPDIAARRVNEAVVDDVSFVRNARRQALWQSPRLRAVLTLFTLILTGLFAAQLAIHYYSALLAFEPGLKPLL